MQKKEKEALFISPKGHVKDRILIHDNGAIPKEGQFISLNGFPFLAKPGEEIDIPRPVREMLDTRIITETHYDSDGKEYLKNIRRLSYTLIKEGVNLVEPEAAAEGG